MEKEKEGGIRKPLTISSLGKGRDFLQAEKYAAEAEKQDEREWRERQ